MDYIIPWTRTTSIRTCTEGANIICSISCNMDSFRVRFVLGLIALSLGHVSGAVDTSTIFFRQYLGHSDNYVDISAKSVTSLKLDPTNETVIILHGLDESVDSDSVKGIATAYLQHTKSNVISIDYSDIADPKIPIVDEIHVKAAASVIGHDLNQMVTNGLNTDNLHIIGYWLGAQLAAQIGSYTNFTIPRITGLNPAGPKFYAGRFLKSGDARFVDIIHTDSGAFDQLHNSGDADFHPNAGLYKPQPGCRAIDDADTKNCNRARSWKYYAESVANPQSFVGVKCLDLLQFNLDNCEVDDPVPMGYATPHTARGNFYLRTFARSPYAEGMQGIY